MDKQNRTPVIAGNWKMNMTPFESVELVNELKHLVKAEECEVLIFPPFIDLPILVSEVNNTKIKIGGQNCHWENSGAFTGEISPKMLKECGCTHVIIGHSERRQYFGETDETVNMRIKAALKSNLCCVVCVGETLSERDNDETEKVIERQVIKSLENIDDFDLRNIIFAYEPVWAIGTGKTATAAQADVVCGFIRELIAKKYSKQTARKIRVLYGGSMKPSNAKELLEQYNIDGGLIGGASLKAQEFSDIIRCTE